MALESFGLITAKEIDAVVSIAHDAALRGEPVRFSHSGIWVVEGKPAKGNVPAKVVITLFAG